MQNKDTIIRELTCLALLNKLSEQLGILINEDNDSRFRNLATQTFTMKQDLEDKIREDNIDVDIDIKSAPNIPTPTQNSNSSTNSKSSNTNTNTTGNGDDEDDDLNDLLSSAISSITGTTVNLDDDEEDDEDDELPFK